MSRTYEAPLLNLKAVVQQTGVKADTLRAWERRYGVPRPQRSDGGQRLYTPQDIALVRWLVARQDEGLSIRRAVDLWRHAEAVAHRPPEPEPSPAPRVAGGPLAQLCDAWIAACLAFDERGAEAVLTQAFGLYPPETVCLDVLQAGVARLGEGWYRGEISIQQEHFATALAFRRLEALILSTPEPNRPGRILAACPPGEEHTLGLLLLTLLLRRRGWDVLYLGANVPAERLGATIAVTRPRLAVLAAHRLPAAAEMLNLGRHLAEERVPLAFGGPIFNLLPPLRDRIPGYFLGEQLSQAPGRVEELMAGLHLSPVPQPAPVPAALAQAREHFRDCQPSVEARVWDAMRALGLPADVVERANRELGQAIDTALALGDLAFLGSDLEWLAGLVRNYGAPAAALSGYLAAYAAAYGDCAGPAGQPVLEWLAGLDAQPAPDRRPGGQ